MLRVTVLELPARWGPGNVDALAARLESGATDLVVVPELAFTGYVSPRGDFDASRFAEPLDGPTIRAVTELCRRRRTHVVAPLPLREGRRVYNASVVVGPEGPIDVYRKRHPWFPEHWATPGTAPLRLRLGGVDVAFAICFDGHFLADERVLEGADLLVFPSAWVDEEDSRLPLLRSLARAFDLTIANANWGVGGGSGGGDAGVVIVPGQGGSCFVRPDGSVVTGETRLDLEVASRDER